jgi:hypothetical protein
LIVEVSFKTGACLRPGVLGLCNCSRIDGSLTEELPFLHKDENGPLLVSIWQLKC